MTLSLRVQLFADGASLDDMIAMSRRPYIRGFTTNPTLMRQAGVRDYAIFARDALAAIPDRPISFEVLSDGFGEMESQAREIASWGASVFVKIPVTNTLAQPSYSLIHRLSHSGVRVNVTAVMTLDQVARAVDALAGGAPSDISVFAGRLADTGRDPGPGMAEAGGIAGAQPQGEMILGGPRGVAEIFLSGPNWLPHYTAAH